MSTSTYMKAGQPWLYDSASGDIVGVRDHDGGDTFFAREVRDSAGNVTGLVGAGGVIPLTPPAYTWAGKPDATTADVSTTIRITDVGVSAFGSLWYTDGTRWRPVGDRLVLGGLSAEVSNGTSTESIALAVAIPAGLLQDGDSISVAPYLYKTGGTADTGVFNFKLGTSAVVAGSAVTNFSQPATTNLRGQATWVFKKVSATSLVPFSTLGATGGGGTSVTSQATATVTVPDMDAQTTYAQATIKLTTGGTETLTLADCQVVFEPR